MGWRGSAAPLALLHSRQCAAVDGMAEFVDGNKKQKKKDFSKKTRTKKDDMWVPISTSKINFRAIF
jgi:hypothetical protein